MNEAQRVREDQELKDALSASLAKAGLEEGESSSTTARTTSEEDLRKAMRMSLEEPSSSQSPTNENDSG